MTRRAKLAGPTELGKKAPPTKTEKPGKKKEGRPTKFTEKMAKEICDTIATCTTGLKKQCENNSSWPNVDTIFLWRYRNPQFSAQYDDAKNAQMDLMAEECVDIADDMDRDYSMDKNGEVIQNREFTARSKLRVETRKFMIERLRPKRYGINSQSTVTAAVVVQSISENIDPIAASKIYQDIIGSK